MRDEFIMEILSLNAELQSNNDEKDEFIKELDESYDESLVIPISQIIFQKNTIYKKMLQI